MDESLREYLDEYLAELEEHIQSLQSGLMTLESDPRDAASINEVFRVTHTIKGNASTMGFPEIASIGHVMEDLLDRARSGKLLITPDMVDVMLRSNDAINQLKEQITGGEKRDVGAGPLVEAIRGFLEADATPPHPKPVARTVASIAPVTPAEPPPVAAPPAAAAAPAAPPAGVETLYYIDLVFDPGMPMKSVRAFLVLTKLAEIGTIVESMPTAKEVEQNLNFDVLLVKIRSKSDPKKLKQILQYGEARESNMKEIPAEKSESPLTALTAWVHGEDTDLQDLLGDEEAPPPPPPPEPARPRAAVGGGAAAPVPLPRPAPSPEAAPSPRAAAAAMSAAAAPAATPARPATPGDASAEGERYPKSREKLLQLLLEDSEDDLARAIESGEKPYLLEIVFHDRGDDARVRALTILEQVRQEESLISSFPDRDKIKAGWFPGRLALLMCTSSKVGEVKAKLAASEVAEFRFEEVVLSHRENAEPVTRPLPQPPVSVDPPGPKGEGGGDEKRGGAGPIMVRVGVDRLNSLMNLVGELVIAKTQFVQALTSYQENGNFGELDVAVQMMNQKLTVITNALQQGIMKVRMVPIGQVFFRFSRMVRDLSKVLGKQVEFIMDGEDTELDKTVIDQIGDPLMHLIRNALDHGIEPPEVRQSLGKRPKGILKLQAMQVGDHIVVEVSDDGGGLDIERIKEKAVRMGVVSGAAIKQMPPPEIYNLIFMPGFSTAEKVTNISGRGVGMDVVKKAFDNLGGDIQMKSEKNQGTTVQIKLPLTLAIIQGLMVRVADQSFAIPLSNVKETILLRDEMIHVINNHRVAKYREEVIPLIYLDDYFALQGQRTDKSFIVFAGDDDNKIGLVVNSLIGRREIVIKSLDKRFIDVKGFAGATILGDGTVSLILDVPSLVEDARGQFL